MTTPDLDMVVGHCIVECRQCRLERCPLGFEQGSRRLPRSTEEGDLEQKLDANLPHVSHRAAEPAAQLTASLPGNAMDDPVRSRVAFLGGDGLCEPAFDQSIEGSIDEGSTHGEDPADIGPGLQLLRQGEAMARSFG